jgi:hypothetical protein
MGMPTFTPAVLRERGQTLAASMTSAMGRAPFFGSIMARALDVAKYWQPQN